MIAGLLLTIVIGMLLGVLLMLAIDPARTTALIHPKE
jgi:hypothetical protein